ncbi:MAG: hypothetical protein PHE54_01030 [Bacilli bacterium]|nr:hypothetical protein [Bacilli bacterium]
MKTEDKIKIANNVFKFIFIALLIAFTTLYLSQATGYYEYEQYQKTVLTEEKIKQFEEDVLAGKNIDINDYIDNTDKNYQNKISRMGLNISSQIGDVVKTSLEGLFKFLSEVIEE